MARARREVDGILLLDKPRGPSSTQVLGRVKYLLQAKKAGHTGALDPRATGLLPLCFGQATKVSGWLLDADKHYVAEAQLGVETDSADLDGAIICEAPVPAIEPEQLRALERQFSGAQEQVPPMVSALKHDGKRLYELARRGVEVERPPRPVQIHALSIEAIAPDRLRIDVHCSKGTYVRSLVADMGRALGCGAAVDSLRRIGHGPFEAAAMVTMEQVEAAFEAGGAAAIEAMLQAPETALGHWPAVSLNAQASAAMRHGHAAGHEAIESRTPGAEGAPVEAETGWPLVRVYDAEGGFLAVGAREPDGRVRPRRLFVPAP
ncbi:MULTISPECIES: tRNA pseudouridine(55) synthase TruB [unclassified Thioalkalivibrio]|uniref:tRNA pseudouridine(55) synthase TruB n=1 Tax=unclassified Thioalkalivibrio TaxID=2621013 RepID=UPI0003769B78|nr:MULTISPECIES: tRNA pseudouridine(55) synthase TruB [unclassified Thioalkalivibrio]